VPPLREREVDVVMLAHEFVRKYNRAFRTQVRSFAPETLPLLLGYDWPGNVRELENAIKSALVVAQGTILRPEFLPEPILRGAQSRAAAIELDQSGARDRPAEARMLADKLAAQPALSGRLFEAAVEATEQEIIRASLERSNGNLTRASKMLGISRTTLRKKLAAYGIEATTSVRLAPRLDASDD